MGHSVPGIERAKQISIRESKSSFHHPVRSQRALCAMPPNAVPSCRSGSRVHGFPLGRLQSNASDRKPGCDGRGEPSICGVDHLIVSGNAATLKKSRRATDLSDAVKGLSGQRLFRVPALAQCVYFLRRVPAAPRIFARAQLKTALARYDA